METEFYMQDSRSYCGNDIMWWAKDGKGYTTNIEEAHVFTKESALKQHRCRESDIPWPADYVKAKTRPAVDMQYVDITTALEGTGIELIKPRKPKKETYRCFDCGRFVSERDYYGSVYHGHPCPSCEEF